MKYKLSKSKLTGFTLIEIMVTIVILSVSLLGLSKMQLTSLRYNQDAYQRSLATQLAYDMTNRMRANVSAAKLGAYDLPSGIQNLACLSVTGCLSPQMAAHDVYEWLSPLSPTSVVNQLPNASAITCLDSSPEDGVSSSPACDGVGSQYAIKIWWSNDAGLTKERFVTSVQI